MTTLRLKSKRGGFLRPFGCGRFIREFFLGHGRFGAPVINPDVSAPQSVIFHEYKVALMKATAWDRTIRAEEKRARREGRPLDPDRILELATKYLERMPYKDQAYRYH